MSTECTNLAEQYRSVCNAISELIANRASSESISTPAGGSRSVTYANLAELRALKRELGQQLAAVGRGGAGCGTVRYTTYV